jgi:hypothetical protein
VLGGTVSIIASYVDGSYHNCRRELVIVVGNVYFTCGVGPVQVREHEAMRRGMSISSLFEIIREYEIIDE